MLLHLQTCKLMLPHFFAVDHVYYARYGLCYLRENVSLPGRGTSLVHEKGHVMRRQRGLRNGLWSDIFIEATFMSYGFVQNDI